MDMVTPSINTLLKKMDSRYALVVLAAKRARQLMEDESILKSDENMRSNKNVTNALEEIAEGKITFKRSKELNV
ncbi:MAG: DNA-directed RNA polymerase subunit omega [Selenomonadaceae bacterium]|nr:DNA-directed RNA polymerase subunit omega [Selenomonadaceae bacterium]